MIMQQKPAKATVDEHRREVFSLFGGMLLVGYAAIDTATASTAVAVSPACTRINFQLSIIK